MRTIYALASVVPFLLGALIIASMFMWQASVNSSFADHCVRAGGHIYEPYDGTTTRYCLTGDGRMLEVYP